MDTYTQHLKSGIATAQDCPLTEIQARVGTKRKRISNDSGIEDIPWTAARCSRLLRTITSRLSILERIGKSDRRKLQTATPLRQCSRTPKRSDGGHLDAFATSNMTPSKDPEWLPRDRQETALTTYGGRPRLRNSTGNLGERGMAKHGIGLSFPTPFVKRILQTESASQSEAETSPVRAKHPNRSKQLPIQTSSVVEEAHRNLLSAFENLLISTRPQQPVGKSAVSSLRSMALRKVPVFIELEESQQNDNDDSDIASGLYGELEILGNGAQGGWCGLQDVVRAHGVRKLELAVSRRLLPSHVVKALIRICERCAALQEGQQLLLAIILSCRANESGQVVDLLLDFSTRNGCRGFLFQALARLLQEQDHFFSAVNEKRTLWRECVTATLDSSSRPAAIAFLEAFVLRSEIVKASLGPAAVTNQASATFMNAIALITAMGMSIGETHLTELSIGASLFQSATSTFLNAGHSDLGLPLQLGNLVFLAMGLQPACIVHTLDFDTIVSNVLQAGPGVLGSTSTRSAGFVCEVARCLDCLSRGAGEEVLHAITRGFLTLAASTTSDNGKVLQKLALDTATAYLEKSNCKTSEEFLDEIEASVLFGADTASSTPKPKPNFLGGSYRWEAGIQEWIAQTPLVMPKTEDVVVTKDAYKKSTKQPTNPARVEGTAVTPTADAPGRGPPQPDNKPCTSAVRAKYKTLPRPLEAIQTTSAFSKRRLSDCSITCERSELLSKRSKTTSKTFEGGIKSDDINDACAGLLAIKKRNHGKKSRSHDNKSLERLTSYARDRKRAHTQGHRIALRPITNHAVHSSCQAIQKHHSCLEKVKDAESVDELSMDYVKPTTQLDQGRSGRTKDNHRFSRQLAWRSNAQCYDQASEDELAM
nr:hypothetical protein CFP56_11426 [Quercus suber]